MASRFPRLLEDIMVTVRSFIVLGLSLIVGLVLFGVQIGRAVTKGREFDRISEVKPAMIEEATSNARAAAEKFAQDSNSRVGRIRRATQGTMEIRERDAASPELKVLRVVTTVDFFLE